MGSSVSKIGLREAAQKAMEERNAVWNAETDRISKRNADKALSVVRAMLGVDGSVKYCPLRNRLDIDFIVVELEDDIVVRTHNDPEIRDHPYLALVRLDDAGTWQEDSEVKIRNLADLGVALNDRHSDPA